MDTKVPPSTPGLVPGISLSRAVEAASLLACLSWLLMHRVLLNRGFVLRRNGLSTDTAVSLLIGLTTTVWSLANLLSIKSFAEDHFQGPWESENAVELVALLARGPLLLQVLFCFWIVSWIDGLWAEKNGNAKPHFWSLSGLNGPFDWASGVHRGFYWTLIATVCVVVILPSIASLLVGDTMLGVLNIISFILFVINGTAGNPYVNAPHRYAGDRLRIVLPTSHHEGTLYVLPSTGVGFDAIWSPKVANEHLEADEEIMTLFQHMRSGRWPLSEPLERLRTTLALYQRRVIISSSQIRELASWIYLDRTTVDPEFRRIHCQRAPGVHLIGRDLMYALCHAEYLVFMAQAKLTPELQSKLGTLRFMGRSGALSADEEETKTVGLTAGFDGYKEAVEYVYAVFDTEVDPLALSFKGTSPPTYSTALSKRPSSIDEYVAELWDASCQHSESVFTALYMFTTVWFIELGNVNGFHIFPLRCRNREGDLVSQQIVWRQAWYSGVVAQLIATSPIVFGLFVLGYLQ